MIRRSRVLETQELGTRPRLKGTPWVHVAGSVSSCHRCWGGVWQCLIRGTRASKCPWGCRAVPGSKQACPSLLTALLSLLCAPQMLQKGEVCCACVDGL